MISHIKNLPEQLKETCKLTKARWAAWFHPSEGEWVFGVQHGLNRSRLSSLSAFIRQPKTAAWLAGTFSSGRVRMRQAAETAEGLGCLRVYIFPNIEAHAALIVGADQLTKQGESFFKILAMNSPFIPLTEEGRYEASLPIQPSANPHLDPLEAAVEVSLNPENVLGHVLELLARSTECDSALMTVRSGEVLRIASVWQIDTIKPGTDLPVAENPYLSDLVTTRQGLILNRSGQGFDPQYLGFGPAGEKAASWMGIPVVIGQRVIGHLAFLSQKSFAFEQTDLQQVTFQAARLAYVVENAIVFAEAARHLQQLALLNELASAASLGVDTNEVAFRVMQRLKRIFRTNHVGVFLLSLNGKLLREYGVKTEEDSPSVIPVENSLVGRVLISGTPLRIGELGLCLERENYFEGGETLHSELAVPLKYRGKSIGALALVSDQKDAFSQQDEQLLVVIASHLAGLFENVRLNEEMRKRAYNLSLIHQVVQKVIGINNIYETARVAARLMAARFSYDFVTMILDDLNTGARIAHRENAPDSDPLLPANQAGICTTTCTQTLGDGVSRLINDTELEVEDNNHPGWSPGSEMCVALKEGERILGVIGVERVRKHAFNENDLLTLEALAGVLSSVVLSAHRYQQLQDTVRKLEAVRATALDITADLELDALLKGIVRRARELVGVKGAELGLLDEKEQVVRVLVSDTPWYHDNLAVIPLMAGVAGRVAAFGEPLVVVDYNTWNGRLFPERIAPFKTVAGVPLKFQDQVIGTLTVMDDRPDWVFRSEHMQLLELLAPQAAVSIRNARLYQELQEHIEAQRLAENRLIRSARLAAVGEMAAGVAHELNNPLTTVAGFAELILNELAPDSPHCADLELVLREAQRARNVVRRLLDFSRPSDDIRTRIDLNEIVQDVLALVNHLLHTGGIEVCVQLVDHLPWVWVDPAQIKQVLLNLVHNSIQAMPAGGVLKIHTAHSTTGSGPDVRKWAAFSVTDNGEGISPSNLERIFEPFFTTRKAGKGTGLGLSVSYGIVSDHGGYIEINSQPGLGSCFTVLLPVDRDERDA